MILYSCLHKQFKNRIEAIIKNMFYMLMFCRLSSQDCPSLMHPSSKNLEQHQTMLRKARIANCWNLLGDPQSGQGGRSLQTTAPDHGNQSNKSSVKVLQQRVAFIELGNVLPVRISNMFYLFRSWKMHCFGLQNIHQIEIGINYVLV